MQRYDVLIVGGGPAGAAVARDVAAAGFSVAILERDQAVGRPVQCSGLVTERTLVTASILPDVAHNELRGASIFSPSGSRYEIGGDRVHAYVMDRGDFDRRMMKHALESNVELHVDTRVVRIWYESDEVRLIAEHGGKEVSFATKLVIGADGPRSIVADFLELPPPVEILRARGADVRLPNRPSIDRVLIFLGERYAAGFFAWAIPLGEDRYRVGWGTSRPGPGNGLEHLAADYPHIFDGMEILSQTGGLIPLGPRPRTSGIYGMVVGDAAGQAKATSGGGLYTALTCAKHCATVAIDALTNHDTSATRLANYDAKWRSHIGKELARATALRQSFRELSDPEIEWGLRMLRIPGMTHLVNRYGDIDYPSILAKAALRTAPPLWRLTHGRRSVMTVFDDDDVPMVHPVGD